MAFDSRYQAPAASVGAYSGDKKSGSSDGDGASWDASTLKKAVRWARGKGTGGADSCPACGQDMPEDGAADAVEDI